MKQCTYCGSQISDDARFCEECGKAVEQQEANTAEEQQSRAQAPQFVAQEPAQRSETGYAYSPQPVYTEPQETKTGNGLGIAGFVLDLIGFVFSCIPFFGVFSLFLLIPGTGLSIAGLIVGICKKKTIGLSIAGIVLGVLAFIVMLCVTAVAAQYLSTSFF